MQYILSETEYHDLLTKKEAVIKLETEKLQALCTKIACTMPSYVNYKKEIVPWGCILDKDSGMPYCDHCPVKSICPCPNKSWSK